LTVSGVTRPAASALPGCAGGTRTLATAGSWNLPWLPASVLTSGGFLRYTLSAMPDAAWGSSPQSAPPSFSAEQYPAVGFSVQSGDPTVNPGQSTTIQVGVAGTKNEATTVRWQAEPNPNGLTVTPSSGTLILTPSHASSGAAPTCTKIAPTTQSLSLTAPPGAAAGTSTLRLNLTAAGGHALPPVVVDVQVLP
jgi:hypothetical protein